MLISIYLYKFFVNIFFLHTYTFTITKIKKSDICLSMKRKAFTTTIKEDSLKEVKKLAIDLDRSVNDLLEEAIEWLLKKYEKKRKE